MSAQTFTDITIRKPARSPVLTTVRTAVRVSSPAPARTAVEFSEFVGTRYRALLGTAEAATADALGCSIGNVKSQTSRALTKLRQDPALTDLWLPNA